MIYERKNIENNFLFWCNVIEQDIKFTDDVLQL